MRKTHRRGKMIKGGVGPLIVATLALYALHSLSNIPHPIQGPSIFTGPRTTPSTVANKIREMFYKKGQPVNDVNKATELFESKKDALKAAEISDEKVPVYIDDNKIHLVVSTDKISSLSQLPIDTTEETGKKTIITLGEKEE